MFRLGNQILGTTVAIMVAAAPVQAQELKPKDNFPEQAEKTLKEGVEAILRTLKTLLKSIPQYETPEVLKNGDIIIRRKKPKDKKQPDDTDST